jgi:Cu/Ag efflux protein CusF
MAGSGTNPRPRELLLAGLVVFVALGGLAAGGCEKKAPPKPPAAGSAPAAEAPQHTYTVRGEIMSLPKPGDATSSLSIRHEAIPDFVRRDGKLGMGSMQMSFTPAPGVSLEGLQPGDKVEFEWHVWWQPRARAEVAAVRKLPPETTLELGRKGG